LPFVIQAFTVTQQLESDTTLVRYWHVKTARMQGLEVEVQFVNVNKNDWESILVWNDQLSRWRDLYDGATFSDLDFNCPLVTNSEPGPRGGVSFDAPVEQLEQGNIWPVVTETLPLVTRA